MKNLKLNLLEKEEMNEVRGGTVFAPCGCYCRKTTYPNGSYSWNTEKVAVKTWGTYPHNWQEDVNWKPVDPFTK